MKFRSFLAALLVVLGVFSSGAWSDSSATPVLELPPVVVETAHGRQDWQYVALPGFEFLSLCSEDQTRAFVAGIARAHGVLRLLVPEEFQVRTSMPEEFILYPQSKEESISAPVLEQMKSASTKSSEHTSAISILPGLRLDGDDSIEVFALINDDERQSNSAWLAIQPGYLEYLIGTRAPSLPDWLHLGLIGLYQTCEVGTESIRVGPMIWISGAKTDEVRENPDSPRALLPLAELFRPESPAAGTDSFSIERRRIWLSETTLFVRWAHDEDQEARIAAFRRFARGACEGPVTEAFFRECFGMGYAQMRDILSDYLPTAVRENYTLRGDLPNAPQIEVKDATRPVVARIRGDWERRAAKYLKSKSESASLTYATQAKLTFQRGLAADPNDPGLLAAAGIAAFDADDRVQAEALLTRALALRPDRPDAYYDLARLTLDRSIAVAKESTGRLTEQQRREVESIAIAGLKREPQIPNLFGILSDVQFRSDLPRSSETLDLIDRGAHLYQNFPVLVFRAAVLEAYYGNRDEAKWLVARGLEHDLSAGDRLRFQNLAKTLGRSDGPIGP